MRRKITLAFLILAAFLLQTTVFQYFQIASVTPNLLLILTSAFGLMRGKKEGLMVGFFSGLMIDLFYGSLFGFYALLYMYIGYLNGFFCKVFYDDDIKVHIVLVAASDLDLQSADVCAAVPAARAPALFRLSGAYYSAGNGIHGSALHSALPAFIYHQP